MLKGSSEYPVFCNRKYFCLKLMKCDMVKCSHYRPGLAQRVGRGIALLFHDHGTRREWVVSNTPRPHFTPGKDPVPILQEPGWAPGSVWGGGKSRLHRDSIPDRPALSQSLYRLSYPAHRSVIWALSKINVNISQCLIKPLIKKRCGKLIYSSTQSSISTPHIG